MDMDFTVGSASAGIWNVYLSVYNTVVPLFSVPIQASDTPINIPLSFPFPAIGGVGVWTTFTTPEDGIIASESLTVDTGP